VCARNGDCKKIGHPKKQEEGWWASVGGYIPLMSSKKMVIGGILRSYKSEAEVEAFCEEQCKLD
jgi:hypothetical protein